MEDNVKSFLDKIQELKERKLEVWTVSHGEVEAVPLSFKQQKDIISTVADGVLGGLKIQKVINDVVIDNIGSNLTILDKLPVILTLRIDSIGDTYKIKDFEINLNEIVNKCKTVSYPEVTSVESEGLTATLKIPTLEEENKVIESTLERLKKDGEQDLSKNIGDIYTFEICKYIDSVHFGYDVLEFQTVPIRDRYRIVENLPLSLNKKIVEFIQKLRKVESSILTYTEDKVSKTFDIDVSFFDS